MTDSERIGAVAVIGAGTIGLSWAVLFAAYGLDVRVTDPRPDLAEAVAAAAADYGPALERLGAGKPGDRIRVVASVTDAVRGADAVQENGPEDLGLKQRIYREALASAPGHAIIASSTSNTVATDLAGDLDGGERIIVGHPLNPPHLVPAVEVVPGRRTSPETVRRAVALYRRAARVPVVEHREVRSFVLSALQYALLGKARELVGAGVVSPAELDELVVSGLGLRWASTGPFAAVHLGGGPGGMRHLAAYSDGDSRTDDPVIDAVEAAYPLGTYAERAAERDARHEAVLAALHTVTREES